MRNSKTAMQVWKELKLTAKSSLSFVTRLSALRPLPSEAKYPSGHKLVKNLVRLSAKDNDWIGSIQWFKFDAVLVLCGGKDL